MYGKGRSLHTGRRQTGIVKSYNAAKGYGFITADGLGGDALFMRTDLPEDTKEVRGKFLEGRAVTFAAAMAEGKFKATNIEVAATEGGFMAGKIKSFSMKNGYGFITSSMIEGDVRFSATDLQALPPDSNPSGALVIFQVQMTPDGKQRVSKMMFQSKTIAERQSQGISAMGMTPQMPQMHQIKQMDPTGQLHVIGQLLNQVAHLSSQAQGKGGATAGFKRPGMGGGMAAKKQKLMMSSTPLVQSSGQYHNGSVKSYNSAKGFGFISTPGLGEDIFFMKSDLPDTLQGVHGNNLQGTPLTYELARTDQGRIRAQNITV
jgi:cold shock CspA family protein